MVSLLAPLHVKLLRDLVRLWPQVLAIAFVVAAGVATLVLGVGAIRSLTDTRDAYYAANRYADVFATVTRAPRTLEPRIRAIDGVLAVDLGIRAYAVFDIDGYDVPGTAMLVSLPENRDRGLNLVSLRLGRLPEPQAADEVLVSENFAKAHGLMPGDRLALVLNGHRQAVRITGIGLSPEFIYVLGPGDAMPDDSRFGIVWMPEAALAAAFDLDSAFNSAFLQLAPGASEPGGMGALDHVLAPYGGTGATGRKDQQSHAFLDAELTQLANMTKILPPIFLAVAAFLVNMTLARLVALEREQVGLLKALGYSSAAVARHYVEFALAVAAIGTVIGLGAGIWLGAGLARLYAKFFSFPWLVFSRSPSVYALAVAISLASAALGAIGAARSIARLPPAVAMAPPAPPLYRRGRGSWLALRQTSVMTLRHLLHQPLRSATSTLGVAFAVAVLVGSFWSFGSIDRMVDLTFYRAGTQDATLSFGDDRPARAALDAVHLPGVMVAEPFRAVAVRISNGAVSRRVALTGLPVGGQLNRVLDLDETVLPLPGEGLILSEALADVLGVRPGQTLRIDRLDGDRRSLELPVSGLSLGYLGLGAYADLDTLNRLMGDGHVISGVNLRVDGAALPAFYAAVKQAPEAGFLGLKFLSVQKFTETLAQNIHIMIGVYGGLAAIIAFGVVYNFARISLSEQGRELASLRVLGFTVGEVGAVLYGEMAAVVLLAQPLGWLIGWLFAFAMVQGFDSELYRVPFVITRDVYAWASIIVLGAALVSVALVRGRIARLDMIEVLKTRE